MDVYPGPRAFPKVQYWPRDASIDGDGKGRLTTVVNLLLRDCETVLDIFRPSRWTGNDDNEDEDGRCRVSGAQRHRTYDGMGEHFEVLSPRDPAFDSKGKLDNIIEN